MAKQRNDNGTNGLVIYNILAWSGKGRSQMKTLFLAAIAVLMFVAIGCNDPNGVKNHMVSTLEICEESPSDDTDSDTDVGSGECTPYADCENLAPFVIQFDLGEMANGTDRKVTLEGVPAMVNGVCKAAWTITEEGSGGITYDEAQDNNAALNPIIVEGYTTTVAPEFVSFFNIESANVQRVLLKKDADLDIDINIDIVTAGDICLTVYDATEACEVFIGAGDTATEESPDAPAECEGYWFAGIPAETYPIKVVCGLSHGEGNVTVNETSSYPEWDETPFAQPKIWVEEDLPDGTFCVKLDSYALGTNQLVNSLVDQVGEIESGTCVAYTDDAELLGVTITLNGCEGHVELGSDTPIDDMEHLVLYSSLDEYEIEEFECTFDVSNGTSTVYDVEIEIRDHDILK